MAIKINSVKRYNRSVFTGYLGKYETKNCIKIKFST